MVLYISISDGKNEELPDNVFVRFKSSQCIHCIHSQPDWDKTVKHISHNYEDPTSGMVEVEAGNEHLTGLKDKNGDDFVVKGYPTYAIFKNGVLDSIYTDERTFKALSDAIIKHLNLRHKSKKTTKKKKVKKVKKVASKKKKIRKIKHEMPSFHIYPTEMIPEVITSKQSIESPKEFDDEIESIKSKKYLPSREEIDDQLMEKSLQQQLSNKELLSKLEDSEDKMEKEEIQDIIKNVVETEPDIDEPSEITEPSKIVQPFMKPFEEMPYDEEELKRRTNTILRKLQDKIKLLIEQEQDKDDRTSKTDLSLSDAPTLELKNVNNEYKIEPTDKTLDESIGGKKKSHKKHKKRTKKHTRKNIK